MDKAQFLGLLLEKPKTEQSLGLTIMRLVNTVEMLRPVVRGPLDEIARAEILKHLNEIETVPGELILACEILAAEFPPTSVAQWSLVQLWFSAFGEIGEQAERFNAALKAEVELDAGPRH